MRIRRNVATLPAGDKTLDYYAAAVTALKARPASDPRSWKYLAKVHGTALTSPHPFWAKCEHGSSFFLPWHRMYLFHFERIVAAEVAKLPGAPNDWALPYWNYFDPAQRTLPARFGRANVNGKPNPLYTSKRGAGVNAGTTALQPKDVDLSALFSPSGIGAGTFFGGGPSAHFGSTAGTIEMTPHNAVHNRLGGGTGWMSDPDQAALDPIFWLHHANIDRLWEVWRGMGNSNPGTPYWLHGVAFDFHDAAGAAVKMIVRYVLQTTIPALDYDYDDKSNPFAAPAPPHPTAVVAAAHPAAVAAVSGGQAGLVGATLAPTVLTTRTAHVDVPTPVTPHAFALSLKAGVAKGPASGLVQRVMLHLEHVTSQARAPTYDVYLGVPDGKEPTDHEDRFVGRIALFGIAQASDPKGMHGGGGQSFALDVTRLYHRLDAEGAIDPKQLRVSFVPVDDGDRDEDVRVGRIALYFE